MRSRSSKPRIGVWHMVWAVYLLLLLRYIDQADYTKLTLAVLAGIIYIVGFSMYLKPFRISFERAKKLSRRTRLMRNGGSHTAGEWEAIKRRYGYRCVKCQQRGLELTKDHIVPVSMGGTDSADNLQPMCRACNSRKGATIADYR